MERQKKIVDASVVVKWFLNEKDSNKALKIKDSFLKGEVTLAAPDLIVLETINSLRYKKKNEKELTSANKDLWGMGLNLLPINHDIILKAIENSVKYNITIYDALYVTLAQVHGAFLITADKELYKIPNVIALEKI